jgi:hypothetical protein
MYSPRAERVAFGAGSLFFLAAIVLFVSLILMVTGTVKAQEYPSTGVLQDALEPDALEEDALGEDVLDKDALGNQRVDFAAVLPQVDFSTDLPLAQVPPRPPQLIPMWFCWRCWAWHTGFRPRIRNEGQQFRCDIVVPAVPGASVPKPKDRPTKKTSGNKKKQV